MEKKEIWIFIFIVGLLGINWPFLEIFHPNEIAYLFIFWLVFIILIVLGAYKTEDKKSKGKWLRTNNINE